MWVSNLARILSKVENPLARLGLMLGVVSLAGMMAVVVSDVASRAIASKGVPGSVDIIGLLLVMVLFAGNAYAQLKGKHIQVDVLVGRLPARAGQIVTTNGYLVTIGIMILTTWQIFDQGMFLKAREFVTAFLHIPQWPFSVITSFFMALFVLSLLVTFLTYLAESLTINGIKAYLWLLPGIIVASGLSALSLWPDLVPFEVTRSLWGGIVIMLLFVLIFLRVHIGAAMALVALLGLSYLSGAPAGLGNLGQSAITVGTTYTWSVIPLFMWMGLLAYHGGFARDLYETAYKWIGWVPGGLASATTVACAGLAAITGSTMTGVLTMGVIALPEMRAYKYDDKLAAGTICTASCIGSLIPPSIAFIVYGMITEVSIGKLFIAGIFPGILFTGMLVAMITIRCRINPKLGPPGAATSWKVKVTSLKDVWAVVLLVIMVLGGLYAGFFTPTEAGAVGCFGALVISAVRKRLTFKGFRESMIEGVVLSCAILFIFIFAHAFTHFLATTRLTFDLAEWIIGLGLAPIAIMASILFIYMILGCLMNSLPAVILTLPIFFPIAMAAGFDPILFGVLIVVMCELGQITPPIGMNVFAMAAIARDIPMYTIFRGILPFWVAYIVLVIILVAFPQISLFLPSFM